MNTEKKCNECGELAHYYCAGDLLIDDYDIPEEESFWCETHRKVSSQPIENK